MLTTTLILIIDTTATYKNHVDDDIDTDDNIDTDNQYYSAIQESETS